GLRRREHNAHRFLTLLPRARVWSRGASSIELLSFHTFRSNEIPGPVGVPLRGRLEQGYHLAAARGAFAIPAGAVEITAYGGAHDQSFDAAEAMSALQTKRSESRSVGLRAVRRGTGERFAWDAAAGL